MKFDEYSEKIRKSIAEGKAYEEYKSIIVEYIEFLESSLEENPRNVDALCRLTVMYLEAREPGKKSIELLENALDEFEEDMTVAEKSEVLNNLAYFYQEELSETDQAKEMLKKAVELETKFPNTYNALGIIHFQEANFRSSLNMFERAVSLSLDTRYRNNYAAALFKLGEIDKAAEIFKESGQEWRESFNASISYFSYGVCKCLTGEKKLGIEIGDELASLVGANTFIEPNELAELYYACGEYEKCIDSYEKDKLYPSSDWLCYYFYSFKAQNLSRELNLYFEDLMAQKREDIREAEVEEEDEDWTSEDIKDYINEIREEIEKIKNLYVLIAEKNFKPELKFEPELIKGCYLIGCPRHDS